MARDDAISDNGASADSGPVGGYPDPTRRFFISISAMLAATMVAVDTTIANVALPHMQASMSASSEEIVWVLTSYLVAAAIATPLSGWLASRFGRKQVMLMSIGGFTVASLFCGIANSLGMLVIARMVQGICGAGLVPLSQATLLDIYPPEKHGKAMAVFGLGSMLGPILGPTLGGYLTDAAGWRWVFFINLPFGLLSFAGMWFFQIQGKHETPGRFDIFGFATISIAVASFQLMLDRGQQLDWFDSTEVCLEAACFLLFAYLAVVHMFTARNTFIKPRLFADRNFAMGCVLSATIGVVAFATIPIITVMMQQLLGYTALRTGLVGAPRGIGTVLSMLVVSRLIGRIDARHFLWSGLALTAVGQFMYARINLFVDQETLVWAGLIQGLGSGLMFVPLSTIVFSTLPGELRNEGASMYNLTRNMGASLGISFLQREFIDGAATNHSRLVESVRPDAPGVQFGLPNFDFGSDAALAQINGMITRQAAMLSYIEVFYLLGIISVVMLPTILLMRGQRKHEPSEPILMLD
jgi:DHA2 family multidrug resistance protein